MKPRIQHRPTPRLLACALAAALAVGAPVTFAQSTGATLRGQAAATTRVTATNTATGLARSVQADAAGNYILAGLPPGTYRVEAEGAPARTVTLSVGQNAYLNVAAAANLETIEVVGAALPDNRNSEVATNVTPRQIEALPQASRNFLSFADTVPGVIFESGNDDSSKLRSGAQNSNGINVFIDGVGQKNYVLKGGISGQDSSRGNPFPQSAIGEYKVITSNYKAEYDQISSAAITAVTKSGTNDFQGSFFWDRTSDYWRSETPAEERSIGGESNTQTEQWGISAGGPILKDRLFYFVTYEGKDIASPRTIQPGQTFGNVALPPDLFALTGPAASPFTEDLWFGKMTWQPDGDNLVELSLKQRNEEEITGIGGVDTVDYGTSKTNDSTRADLRWQFNQETWLNDAHLTFEDEEWSPHAINNGVGFRFTGTPSDARGAILNVGAGRDFQDKGQKGWSLQDDFNWFGWENHTIKAGFKYKDVKINAFEQQPYNPQYYVNLPENVFAGRDTFGEYIPYQVEFGALVPGVPSRNIETKAKQFGIYLQDDWQVTEHLILNLGLRWDYEQNESWENFVTPANIAAALRAWPNIHGPNVDYNIENYISNGSNRDAFKDAWQPRLGFSYDINADERHVVFGGAGRTYDRNLWDYLQLEQSKYSFPTYQFHFINAVPALSCDPATDARCFTWDTSFYDPNVLAALVASNPNLGAEVNLINNDLKTPYSDQFSLGMRNAFDWGNTEWNLATTVVRIESHDGIIFSLGNRFPDGSFRDPNVPGATWGNQPWGFPIPGFGTLIKADNGIETKLNQFLLSLDKIYSAESPWSMTIAWTYSDASENRFNAANADEHYLFDYPNLDNQPFLTSVGVPENRLVVSGLADIWWDMTFSGKLTLASPYPKDSVNCHDTTSFNNCFFDEFTPSGDIGFKQLDLALRKGIDTGTNLQLWARVDVLNLFNWHNWTDYDTWRGGPLPDFNPNFGEQNGYNINGVPRTFKLSVGFDF